MDVGHHRWYSMVSRARRGVVDREASRDGLSRPPILGRLHCNRGNVVKRVFPEDLNGLEDEGEEMGSNWGKKEGMIGRK